MALITQNKNITIGQKITTLFSVLSFLFVLLLSFNAFAFDDDFGDIADYDAQVEANDDAGYTDAANTTTDVITDVFTTIYVCGYPDDPTQFICDLEQTCWFCGPLNTVISVMQTVAQKTYAGVKTGMLGLLAICACIWMVIKIMKYIGSLKYQDVADIYTDIAKSFFKVLIAASVISMGDGLWNYTVSPLASGVFDYGTAAITLDNQSTYCSTLGGSATATAADTSGVVEASTPVSVVGQNFIGTGGNAGGIMTVINQRLMSLIGVGWVMMSASMNEGTACVPDESTSVFFAGIPLVLFGIILLFAIPLKCADIIFRLGIFLVLLPIFIFAWAFPITKDFATKGLNMLISVMVSFLIFSVMVGLCTELIMNGLGLPSTLPANVDDLITNLQQYYSLDTVDFVRTMALLVFSFVVINQATDITRWLSDTNYDSADFEKRVKKVPSQVYNAGKNVVRAGMAIATAGQSEAIAKAAQKVEAEKEKKKEKEKQEDKEG